MSTRERITEVATLERYRVALENAESQPEIAKIIDVSKIESGLVKTDIKASNLSELIKYIYNFFKPEAKRKGIQLQLNNSISVRDIIIKTDYENICSSY